MFLWKKLCVFRDHFGRPYFWCRRGIVFGVIDLIEMLYLHAPVNQAIESWRQYRIVIKGHKIKAKKHLLRLHFFVTTTNSTAPNSRCQLRYSPHKNRAKSYHISLTLRGPKVNNFSMSSKSNEYWCRSSILHISITVSILYTHFN